MPDFIKDGTGGGYLAEVDKKNRLYTYSIVEDEPTYINRVEYEMYSGNWSSSGIVAATAGNFIIYLKNTSLTKDLVITKLKHRCEDASGSISVYLNVTGTPGGSLTDLTPGNRNASSNNTADCTYQYSTNITGLSNGRVGGSSFLDPTLTGNFIFQKPCSGWILPTNGTLAVKADNNTSKHFGGFSIYFRDKV